MLDREILHATIIPPESHPITPDMIDPDARTVLKKLNAAGFSAYLVGGGVRDLYLGKTPKDYDISTDARPGQIRKIFPNSTTIGRRFRLVQVYFRHGKIIEVSTLRSLSEHDIDGPDAVLAPNNTFGTVEEDAQRRDITINSLFYDIRNGTIIDYVNGVTDLNNAVVRIIGNPDKRIHNDPVRMMRAIRHGARNGFTIEPASWAVIRNNCNNLTLCPPSRLRDEIFKDIYSGAAAPWFQLALDSGIFTTLFPMYRKILSTDSAQSLACRAQITALLQVQDRLNLLATEQQLVRQADYFQLAFLLVPYTEITYHLYSEKRKGSVLFQLAKRLRADLDNDLGQQLNLRRSLRQDMCALLTNLALLIQHKEHSNWPKWLRQKSYFAETLLFYQCYMEATAGVEVDASLIDTPIPQTTQKERSFAEYKNTSKAARPALSTQKKGGIFGLKK